jgi:A/G-specific adenine glycosylase
MPWRKGAHRDPYGTWVSETMLQQTRSSTVIPYWTRFVAELPTVRALAEAPESQVLSLWSGLGYYRRARMLHAAAKRVMTEFGGQIPADAETLRELEGIGPYTAGAIASIAFGRRAAAVDGNVARVIARLFALEGDVTSGQGRDRVWQLAEELLPADPSEVGAWNEALMELGATVCTPRSPACGECPIGVACLARQRGMTGEVPRPRARKAPREVHLQAIVLVRGGEVLLARRKAGGLFGGLWEVPTATIRRGESELAVQLGVNARGMQPLGEVVHVLSHRRMVVAVSRAVVRRQSWPVPGEDYEAVEWARTGEGGAIADGRPHASLTRRILAIAT